MFLDNRSRNSENYDECMGYLGMVHSIIQESDVSSVFVIGDWNAEINANSVFGSELSSFCTDHSYVISDIEHLGIDSGSFTFFSEAHGSTSWIDHCVCTGRDRVRVRLMPVFLQLMLFMILRARTIFLCPFVLILVLFPCWTCIALILGLS